MGAFAIINRNCLSKTESIKATFKRKGFSTDPFEINSDFWKVLYYPKQKSGIAQIVEGDRGTLIVVGTLIRPGLRHQECLDKTYKDIFDESNFFADCIGSFGLIKVKQKEIEIILDKENTFNCFYDLEKTVISNSFLAVKQSLSSLSINKEAALENLLSGSLIGPDTLINEINRFETEDSIQAQGLKIRRIPKLNLFPEFKGNRNEIIENQIDNLNNYFNGIKNFADEQGVDSGLTSGFDSRLILALIEKNFSNFQIHSHYRHVESRELKIAQKISRSSKIELRSDPVKNSLLLDQDSLKTQFEKAYQFCDGIIRMHGYWMEEYNTSGHRIHVLNDKNLGISGIGGEQYRNMENLIFSNYNLEKWIKFKLLLLNSGDVFKDKKTQAELILNMSEKISKKLSCENESSLSQLEIKRYLNEIFIPSRLAGRNNSENALSFFLSPFIDGDLSFRAYQIIPYLGFSLGFQAEMLKKIDPQLASIESDYGFNFHEGEPYKNRVRAMLKGLLPFEIQLWKNERKFSKNLNEVESLKQMGFINDLLNNVENLGLGIDLNKFLRKPNSFPLALDLGFFLSKL